MFNGFVRFFIFVTTLFVAWLATGRLLAATHPPDWWWLGYVQATGVELVLGYCVWLIARTTEKGIVGVMILFFGLFSVAAQILHAMMFGVQLPGEDQLPVLLVYAWKYVLPAIPTLAGVSVGLLELAENRRDPGPGISESLSRFVNQFARNENDAPPSSAPANQAPALSERSVERGEARAYGMDVERLPFDPNSQTVKRPRRAARRPKK